jgi:hypothetical protein
MRDKGNESHAGTILVGEQNVDDRSVLTEIFGGVDEKRRENGFAFQCLDESFRSDRQQCFLSTGGNHLIGIVRENGENLDAVDRGDVRTGAADGDFALAGSTAVTEFVKNFRGEGFHWVPA